MHKGHSYEQINDNKKAGIAKVFITNPPVNILTIDLINKLNQFVLSMEDERETKVVGRRYQINLVLKYSTDRDSSVMQLERYKLTMNRSEIVAIEKIN